MNVRLEEKRNLMLQRLKALNIQFKWITCDKCPDRDKCEFAYDPYNIDGDCLCEK